MVEESSGLLEELLLMIIHTFEGILLRSLLGLELGNFRKKCLHVRAHFLFLGSSQLFENSRYKACCRQMTARCV